MAFPGECYDPETLQGIEEALDAAWDEVEFMLASNAIDPQEVRTILAIRIMAAVRHGERDPERLRELALDAVAKAY